ncbi:MAG: fibrobacter succinogenes major paralogous domain-containing protein [Chitinophagales bacterium]|nr:fibrobacter succinogenes major paralogous domain-containing protein [Chitinophagales bacterium]
MGKCIKLSKSVIKHTWFAENLRYTGNIAEITDDDDWRAIFASKSNTPAWSYYNNDPTYNKTYGKLYNWFAVNSGNLCPNGWHIPSLEEWVTLRNNYGGQDFAGDKLKSTTDDWITPKTNATNESGFAGRPGGWRSIKLILHSILLEQKVHGGVPLQLPQP